MIAAGVAVTAVLVASAWPWIRGPTRGRSLPVPGERGEPTVEVLNATPVDGLAREITRRLRREGFDVVSYGNWTTADRDSTVILVRRGDSAAAVPIREALGAGRIVVELDPRLLLDASVVVGGDLAPLRRDP